MSDGTRREEIKVDKDEMHGKVGKFITSFVLFPFW